MSMNTKSEQVLLPSTIGINALRAKKKAINGMAVRKKGNRLPVLVRTISEYAVTMGMKATTKKVSMFMTNPVARLLKLNVSSNITGTSASYKLNMTEIPM